MPSTLLVVMAADSMLRGQDGRKLEAGDFTTRLIPGASASLWRLRRSLIRGIKRLSLAEAGDG
jgi:hypothetical protein